MPESGELLFIELAVQVIPVIVVVIMAEEFTRRDVDNIDHRYYASIAVVVGLVFGIAGEVAGFQGLLTGRTWMAVPVVGWALIALGATALLPRLAELLVGPKRTDAARGFVNSMLPVLIGSVGTMFVFLTLGAPWQVQALLYPTLIVWLMLAVRRAINDLKSARAAAASKAEDEMRTDVPTGGEVSEDSKSQQSHHPEVDNAANSTIATPTRRGWWLVASMAAAGAASLAIEHRRRKRSEPHPGGRIAS